jgi:chromosome segregation ATPase
LRSYTSQTSHELAAEIESLQTQLADISHQLVESRQAALSLSSQCASFKGQATELETVRQQLVSKCTSLQATMRSLEDENRLLRDVDESVTLWKKDYVEEV